MKPKQFIYDHLSADAGVLALVGDRIYPGVVDFTSARPYVAYDIAQADPNPHVAGVADLVRHVMTIMAFDDNDIGAWDVADAIRTALDGYTGEVSGITVDVVFLMDEQDDYVYETDSGEIGAYAAVQTYDVWTRR